MGLETPVYISDLNTANPSYGDPRNQGDDHIRNIKVAIKNTFTSISGAVNITHTELNYLSGLTQNVQTAISSIATKAAAGVNTDITSLNGPNIGAATATTPAAGDNDTSVATTAFVTAAISAASDLLCPPGTILPFAGSTVPTGFLLCPTAADVQLIATYPRLAAALGTLWGGDGITTFGIPWFPEDYTILQAGVSVVGSSTVGQVIEHNHTAEIVRDYGRNMLQARLYEHPVGPMESTTGTTGGSANLAAGKRVKFIVKI